MSDAATFGDDRATDRHAEPDRAAGADPSSDADADLAAYLGRIADDGYAVLAGAIDPDLCDAIADDLIRLEGQLGIGPGDNLFEGLHTTRIYNLLVHGPLYQAIPTHPNVLPVVEGVLDPGLLI